MKLFNPEIIQYVAFDIDGTLFQREKEYKKGRGSVEDAHEFFRLGAWQRLKQGVEPYTAAKNLVREYICRSEKGTLNEFITGVPRQVKKEYDLAVKKNGSNGKTFNYEFDLNNSSFLHKTMIQYINFQRILCRNELLCDMFNDLKQEGYSLGILTTETYKTAQDVAKVLGFDLTDFKMETGNNYPILCSENVKEKKPSAEGFLKLIQIYNTEPGKILYVGDHIQKDIISSLSVGLQAVHIVNDDSPAIKKVTHVNGENVEYYQIGQIHTLNELLGERNRG